MMLAESEEWSDDRAAECTEARGIVARADRRGPRRGRRKEHDQSVFMQEDETERMETEEKGGRPAHIALPD